MPNQYTFEANISVDGSHADIEKFKAIAEAKFITLDWDNKPNPPAIVPGEDGETLSFSARIVLVDPTEAELEAQVIETFIKPFDGCAEIWCEVDCIDEPPPSITVWKRLESGRYVNAI